MSKVEQFKKWMSERQGHSPQLKLAIEAIHELELQVVSQSNPTIFWEKENTECSVCSPEESISEYMDAETIGQVIEFSCAKELPNFKVKVLGDNDDGSINLEYL